MSTYSRKIDQILSWFNNLNNYFYFQAKKPHQELEEALKENQELKDKFKDLQNQLIQKHNQLAEVSLSE